MTSAYLNAKISEWCDGDQEIYDSFGGKPVGFIGWFWRTVNFDRDYCFLGVIPAGADGNSRNVVGFMENNKWGYPSVKAEGATWLAIRQALEKAVESGDGEDFKAADELIQSLARDEKYTAVTTVEWV